MSCIILILLLLKNYSYCFQVNNKCSNNLLIYNSIYYTCNLCDQNKISNENQTDCICQFGYFIDAKPNNETNIILKSNNQISLSSCKKCPANFTSSVDRTECLKCPNGIDLETNECICDFNKEILVEDKKNKIKQCIKCNDDSLPDPFSNEKIKYRCISCPLGMKYEKTRNGLFCTCKNNYVKFGNICFANEEVQNILSLYSPQSAKSITYYKIEVSLSLNNNNINSTSQESNSFISKIGDNTINSLNQNYLNSLTVPSDLINELYLNSVYNCISYENKKACQTFANLCVLQLYDESSTVCKLYSYLMSLRDLSSNINKVDKGSKLGLPWIYYKNSPSEILNNESKVNFDLSVDKNDPLMFYKLEFVVYVYSLEGELLRIEPLTDQLSLCSKRWEDGNRYKEVQTSFQIFCEIDLYNYFQSQLLISNQKRTMEFYEIFLKDYSKEGELIDIPILISNIINKSYPGQLNNSTDINDWILTRRFFIQDSISSIQGDGSFLQDNSIPIIFRFASEIKIIITLQNVSSPRIYVPYIQIYYYNKLVTSIKENTSRLIQFSVDYNMDITNFINIMLGLLIGFIVTCIIASSIKTYIWRFKNPNLYNPKSYIFRILKYFIFVLFGLISKTIFWFLFGISFYWFIYFKFAYRIYLWLPPVNDNSYTLYYQQFYILFYISFTIYSAYIIILLIDQCSFQIFFIDWEHDKEILKKNKNGEKSERYKGAWRILNLINQFHELETHRIFSIMIPFTILYFAWYYLEWGFHTTLTPNILKTENSPQHFMLRYFVSKFILVLSGIGLIIFKFLIQRWFPYKADEFVDLCVVSNISVLILDTTFHGYYIHGQCPSGKSDEGLDVLNEMLEEESENKFKSRGLEGNDDKSTSESYEIFISIDFREEYDKLLNLKIENNYKRKINQTEEDYLSDKRYYEKFRKHIKSTNKEDKLKVLSNIKKLINAELKEKIIKIFTETSKYVKPKLNYIQKLFDFHPIDIIGKARNDIIFFRDDSNSYMNMFLMGIEWNLYMWSIYWFLFIFLVTDSISLGIFISFIVDLLVIEIRKTFGERNISKWSFTDDRFII